MVPDQFQVQYRQSALFIGAVPPRRHEMGPWSQFNFGCGAGSPGRITRAVLHYRQEVGPWSQINFRCSTGSPRCLSEQFRLAGTRWDRGPSSISGAVPGVRAGLPERFCITDTRWDRGPSSIQSAAWRSGPGYRMIYATQKGDEMIALDWKK